MSIASTVKQYLDEKHIIYDVLDVAPFESPYQAAQLAKIPPQSLYYPIVLRDPFGLLMAVLPAARKLELERLAALLHRNCEPALQTQLSTVFDDCQPGHIPPLGEAYGIRTIIDAEITTPEEVYIVTGNNAQLIKLKRKDFMMLQANAWLGSNFTSPVDAITLEAEEAESDEAPVTQSLLRERVAQTSEMPPMPQMAQRIFELRSNPNADVAGLVKTVELDPSLSAQVLRYANSPYFGYRGEVNSLQAAIARVLGFDMVMNLALGLTLVQGFQIPRYGVIGLDAYWRHAIFSANLMQNLCKEMPKERRPRAATCYLVGLLHDFGYLVLGHLFPEEFRSLNERLSEHEDDKRADIEREYLGIDHGELGAWLLKAWRLPDELVLTTKHHHDLDYEGAQSPLIQMCRLSDYLISVHEMGEDNYADMPQDALAALGLSDTQVMRIMIELLEQNDNLESMARRLVA